MDQVGGPQGTKMLGLLSDENFNGQIVRGLFRAQPELDLVRVQVVIQARSASE